MTELCGDLWPDQKAPDGRDVTCQLDAGHGGLWHSWWHELHVKPGKRFGHGRYDWPTALHTLLVGDTVMTPKTVELEHPLLGPERMVRRAVRPHPLQVVLHSNKPEKPVRR